MTSLRGWESADCGGTRPGRRSCGSTPASSWSTLTSSTSLCCRPPPQSWRARATSRFSSTAGWHYQRTSHALFGRVLPAAATTSARPIDDGGNCDIRSCAFISCRLDYCNSLLYAFLPDTLLRKLQSVQNATARLITGTRRRDHITQLPREFHWLPIRERVKFRVACLVRQSLSGSGHLSTWQMTAASCPTALGALCGQLTFWLAWCREHSAVTATELLQPLHLACGTLFQSSCAIQTSPTDCSYDSWMDTFFRESRNTALCDFWYAERCLRKTLTYLLTV